MSINQSFGGLSYGIGLIFLGTLADLTDIRTALVTGGALMVVGVAVIARRVPDWRSIVDGVSEPADVVLSPTK